jgi:hypothetical protein
MQQLQTWQQCHIAGLLQSLTCIYRGWALSKALAAASFDTEPGEGVAPGLAQGVEDGVAAREARRLLWLLSVLVSSSCMAGAAGPVAAGPAGEGSSVTGVCGSLEAEKRVSVCV